MSGARHRLVVCYDVREPKRLRTVHKAMLGYGDPLQYSVFVCDLSRSEQLVMQGHLLRIVHAEDSVAIVDLGPAAGMAQGRIRHLGQKTVATWKGYTIV